MRTRALSLSIVCFILLFFRAAPLFSGQIIINCDDQFNFAHTCMDRGEYGLAVGEFERFMHFFPESPMVPEARYLIGVCFLRNQQFDKARQVFSQIIKGLPGGPFAGKALFMIGESYYQQDTFKEAGYYFQKIIETYEASALKNDSLYRLGWIRMQADAWQDASEIFGTVGEKSRFYDTSHQLAELSLEGEKLPYKSPGWAASLAIVPGLGHAYTGRYKDAAVSFMLNGLFIWAAAESFRQDHDVLGGILTCLELGWYAGNIYSAANVAHKHNRKVRDDFRRGLKERFDLSLYSAGEALVGLALTFHF